MMIGKLTPCAAAVLGFMLVFCTNSKADLVYDNGAPSLLNGFEITHWVEANRFTVNDGAVLGGITFWDIEATPTFLGQVYWEIRNGSSGTVPGAVLFSGMSADLTHALTGRIAFVYPEYVNQFTVPSVSLPAGSYWLVLHNGPLSNNITRNIFWESAVSNNPAPTFSDAAPFAGNWQTNGSPSQMAFQLIGLPGPRITSITVVGGEPRISFTTVAGQHYRAEYKNSLLATSWAPVTGAGSVAGTGGIVQVIDPEPAMAMIKQRFYRIVLL